MNGAKLFLHILVEVEEFLKKIGITNITGEPVMDSRPFWKKMNYDFEDNPRKKLIPMKKNIQSMAKDFANKNQISLSQVEAAEFSDKVILASGDKMSIIKTASYNFQDDYARKHDGHKQEFMTDLVQICINESQKDIMRQIIDTEFERGKMVASGMGESYSATGYISEEIMDSVQGSNVFGPATRKKIERYLKKYL